MDSPDPLTAKQSGAHDSAQQPSPQDTASELFEDMKEEVEEEVEEGRFSAYPVRQLTSIGGGALAGVVLGLNHGATTAGLRFRAENAHRLPTSSKSWYLYHKSKNYVAMWGGLREAARMAPRLAFWSGAFIAVEESVDRLRHGSGSGSSSYDGRHRRVGGHRDALSTVVAGLAVAGGFSAWNRFPMYTAARAARMGLVFGLGYGLLQDAYSLVEGRPVSYVEFVKRRLGGTKTVGEAVDR